MIRFILDILLLVSIFIFPPVVTGIFIFLLIIFLNNYLESIFFAFIIDTIYGGKAMMGGYSSFVFTITFLIVFILSFKIKTMLKFYPRK